MGLLTTYRKNLVFEGGSNIPIGAVHVRANIKVWNGSNLRKILERGEIGDIDVNVLAEIEMELFDRQSGR